MKTAGSKCFIYAFMLAGLFVIAEPALATQTHSQPEGLYVHQIAHIFFIISMGSLEFWLRQRNLTKEKGWRYIQLAAVLFILWNIDAIAVHFLDEHLDIFGIAKIDLWHIQFDNPEGQDIVTLLYYLMKLDHLLCVPAMFSLYYGLKTILRNTVADQGDNPAP
ncbi:MAG: hypothetical protein ABFS43_03740 [Thermodesulfobacteriota bacterium]